MKKITLKGISNEGNYNILTIDKSEILLDNFQDFIIDVGLGEIDEGEYEVNGKSYDRYTFYILFYETDEAGYDPDKKSIKDFHDGTIIRYLNKEIDLSFIFFEDKIKIIFYCNNKNRKKVLDSFSKFCEL